MRYFFYLFLLMLSGQALLAQEYPELIPYKDGNKWGYADIDGDVAIPAQWPGIFFFDGDKAIVTNTDGRSFSLIDKKGKYIIPPERHWSGDFSGWRSKLNSHDNNNRWGLIDTNNNVLIPYEWDEPRYSNFNPPICDSYKVVYSEGLAGLINRTNQLIIPCKYGDITDIVTKTRTLVVTDPDNKTGRNAYGLVDMQGRQLLPARYNAMQFFENKNNSGFVVDMGPNGWEQSKWTLVDFPSLKEIKLQEGETIYESVRKEAGYIRASRSGTEVLLDTNRNILMPGYAVEKFTRDTIVTKMRMDSGDSIIYKRQYLDTRTLKPLRVPAINAVYKRPWEMDNHTGNFTCGNGARAGSRYQGERAQIPSLKIEDIEAKEFFKDSLFYRVEKSIDDPDITEENNARNSQPRFWSGAATQGWYTVYGSIKGMDNRPGYGAVVDEKLNYVVRPIANMVIIDYNRVDDMITVAHRYPEQGYGIINSKGEIVYPFAKQEISGGFRWKKRIYVYTVTITKVKENNVRNPDYEYSTIRTKRVAGTTGEPAEKWKRFNLEYVLPKGLFDNNDITFFARDSTDFVSILNAEGDILYPEISGKYHSIRHITGKYLLVYDIDNTTKLVDTDNNEWIPGLRDIRVAPTLRQYFYQNSRYKESDIRKIPGLYSVQGKMDGCENELLFYMDADGTAYPHLVPGRKKKR